MNSSEIRSIESSGREYRVSLDDEIPVAQRTWGIVKMRISDELTGEPPVGRIKIRTVPSRLSSLKRLSPWVSSGGIAGLVGRPQSIVKEFESIVEKEFDVIVQVDGYLDHQQKVSLKEAFQNFPDGFSPHPRIDIILHREPILIHGRLMKSDPLIPSVPPIPFGDAKFSVNKIWMNAPSGDDNQPPSPHHLFSLHPPLYFPRKKDEAQLRHINIGMVVGEDKILLEEAKAGDTLLKISDREQLVSNSIISIDADDPAVSEMISIAEINETEDTSHLVEIRLNHPLKFRHRKNALVQRWVVDSLATGNSFSENALTGDQCVLLDSDSEIPTDGDSLIEISGGSHPNEFHRAYRFLGTTGNGDNNKGKFNLPFIHRVAQLEIEVNDGSATQYAPQTIVPDYGRRENQIDIIFKPV